MVEFISWEEAMERVRHEPVLFAEVMSEDRDTLSLELHVMHPGSRGAVEFERDDTGGIPIRQVHDVLRRIAADNDVRYAAIHRAEKQWPPDGLAPR